MTLLDEFSYLTPQLRISLPNFHQHSELLLILESQLVFKLGQLLELSLVIRKFNLFTFNVLLVNLSRQRCLLLIVIVLEVVQLSQFLLLVE